MHTLSSTFVLGYHGCDRTVGEKLLAGEDFKKSENSYDWLGSGIYFWENNPKRGLDFAKEMSKQERFKARYKEPYVVGAIIEYRNCLDLSTLAGLGYIQEAYKSLKNLLDKVQEDMPINDKGYLSHLDCAVINHLHTMIEETKGVPIDTIKGVFIEGDPVYPTAKFHKKTHIQICVRNPECIKGVFRVK